MRIGKKCTIDPKCWVDSTLSEFKKYFKGVNHPEKLEEIWREVTKGKKKAVKKEQPKED